MEGDAPTADTTGALGAAGAAAPTPGLGQTPGGQPQLSQPPPHPLTPVRLVFDVTFVGPIAPPPSPPPVIAALPRVEAPPPAPVSDAVLAIPLGTRRLVAMALDLLTRPDAGLRSASFYVGFMLLLTAGPLAALVTAAALALGPDAFGPGTVPGTWAAWTGLAALPALLGYIAVTVEARSLAVAVIGGRAEGRPLRLRESISVARRRFWRVLGAGLVTGILTTAGSYVATSVADAVLGPIEALDLVVNLVAGLLVGAPFVYATAGIVMGEVGVGEAISRSIRLARARKRLAIVVAMFGILSQLIVVLGLNVGLDTVSRVADGAGLVEALPAALAIPVVAALVFALGTLTFLVAAIAAAPSVHAFAALTHYTNGLELGRREPLAVRHVWDPWVTPGLAIGAGIALLALLAGIASLPAWV
jgi:hypothetical protein